MKNKSFIWIFLSLFFLSTHFIFAQEEQKTEQCTKEFTISSDFVSRYIWRGIDYYNTPSIQPTLAFTYCNFSAGAWGSFSMKEFDIQETHLFVSYSHKFISLTIYDYFYMNYNDSIKEKGNNYFNYDDKTTSHDFSADLKLTLPEEIPLYLLFSYNFYGNDPDDSFYFELGYTTKFEDTELQFFVGGTPDKGWYYEEAGIVNVGIKGSKNIKITEHFSLPVHAGLIVNPARENIYMVFGISL